MVKRKRRTKSLRAIKNDSLNPALTVLCQGFNDSDELVEFISSGKHIGADSAAMNIGTIYRYSEYFEIFHESVG